jgi:hypothetical protein
MSVKTDEARAVTQDINALYVNFTGVLDNLCSALLHECAADKLPIKPHKLKAVFFPRSGPRQARKRLNREGG